MEAVSSFVIFELAKRVLFCFVMHDGVGRIFEDVVSWTFQLAGDKDVIWSFSFEIVALPI